MLTLVCRCVAFLCVGLLLAGRGPAFGAQNPSIQVVVRDASSQPVAGVSLQLMAGDRAVAQAQTVGNGHATLAAPSPGNFALRATKSGFEASQTDIRVEDSGVTEIQLTLVAQLTHTDSIEVHESAPSLERDSSVAADAPVDAAKELPGRPPTVTDMLPLVPGVARASGGGLQISGAGEHRSALIVNSADVTDPATGQFGLTVPVDSVQKLDVYQTPFLAEYGRFTAGVVSVETRRGGDKWKWELNDLFPDFFIRSYHLRGLRDATPRLNFEGPLVSGKLFLSEGLDYVIRKTSVYTLPFPYNQSINQGFNSFTQFDWIASSRQWLTATVHAAPQRLDYVNINFYNPQPTTPDAFTTNYTATLADRISFGGGVLEGVFSVTRFSAGVWGQGTQDLTMTPTGNSGNYFAQQSRQARRFSFAPVYTFAEVKGLGTHHFKAGAYLASSSDSGRFTAHPIDLLGIDGGLLETIAFSGGRPFSIRDTEVATFAQDHWLISPNLAVDLGVRAESQEVSHAVRVAPRAGMSWTLSHRWQTIFRAGAGYFYDRVPLNVYSFGSYPQQVITTYAPDGSIASGPFVYQNLLGETTSTFRLVSQAPQAGNFSPRSVNGSLEIEQPIGERLRLRVRYLQNVGSGLVLLNAIAPDAATRIGAYSLTGSGTSRYRQLETSARLRLSAGELFFSYVRSQTRGDLNDFSSYLGSFPVPIIRPDQFSYLPTNMPNRFLAWGMLKFPRGIRISPVVEYRTGFPFLALDAYQNYAGVPYARRFPAFLSADARISKDIRVNPKYAVRLSVSTYNLTNHFNPEAVRSNTADPAFGYFFGQRGRHFTADFDVIF